MLLRRGDLQAGQAGQLALPFGAHRLQLSVTGRNEAAIQFYMRLGFAFTGKIIPYPNDPTEIEREMELMIADPTAT